MPIVGEILDYVQTLAPADLKLDWDNVGLLCGHRDRPVSRVLVALDPFLDAAEEAADLGAELLLTHHPLIFHPCRAVSTDTETGRVLLYLIEHGVAAVNAHTNLDRAPGGVNDVLAARLGLSEIRTIPGADGMNLLRMGEIPAEPLESFLDRVKERLGTPVLRYAQGREKVRRVAVGGGACGSEMMDAIAAGCDTFVTSDLKYNDFWDARDLGLNLIDAGHFYTENPVCAYLAERVQAQFPDVFVKISENHRDCMKFR